MSGNSFKTLPMMTLYLACCTLLCGSPVRASEVITGVNVSSLEPDFLDQFSIHKAASGLVSSFLDVEGISNYPGFHATGSATATPRTLGVSAQVLTPFYAPDAFDNTMLIQAQAEFVDTLVKPGVGTGFVSLTFDLSGGARNSHPDILRSGMFLTVNVGGTRVLELFSDSLGFYPTGTFNTALIPITFGQDFLLSGHLEGYVSGRGVAHDGDMVSGIFYGNTAKLTTVQLFDAARNPLVGAILLSESGTDYLAPIPLPGCAAWFALSVLGLSGRRRPKTAGAPIA